MDGESAEPMLRWFRHDHLPEHLAQVSRPFADLAQGIVDNLARSPERTVALRKLLESKDAAVRAAMPPEGQLMCARCGKVIHGACSPTVEKGRGGYVHLDGCP